MKSKALKSYHLPTERDVLYSFDAKPYSLLLIAAVVSLFFAIEGSYFLLGVICLFSCIFALVILPNRLLLEFSEHYVVVYHRINKNDCMLVYYEDILEYSLEKNKREDTLSFLLKDGEEISLSIYERVKVEKVLKHFMDGKKKKRNHILK